jgi:hypothetical protein
MGEALGRAGVSVEGGGAWVVGGKRFDPYGDYKFRVKWDGRLVAGITHVS